MLLRESEEAPQARVAPAPIHAYARACRAPSTPAFAARPAGDALLASAGVHVDAAGLA